MFADLYELTMLQGYWRAGLHRRRAVFDLFYRRPPFGGAYAVSAGQADALRFLAEARFADDDLRYLAGLGPFAGDFVERLRAWRFAGDVEAMPEGTPAFPFEPILRVTAALEEAQLVESALLNIVNFQSLLATKAARICREAGADNVLEFGMRGAQGVDGALTASRACFVGGCAATSNVEAAQRWGIRPSGTMAHSWVLAFPSELEAFRRYAEVDPDHGILLLDTYDTLRSGAPHAIVVGRELAQRGKTLFAVRLDSGDLAKLAAGVRRLFDRAGLTATRIVASGDLDEFAIRELKRRGAPIDFFGVGRRLVAAHGDESFTGVYKLAAVDDERGRRRAVHKLTDDRRKATLPGVKQAWRLFDRRGAMLADWLDLDGAGPSSSSFPRRRESSPAAHDLDGAGPSSSSFPRRRESSPATLTSISQQTEFVGRALHSGRVRRLGKDVARVAPLLRPAMRDGVIAIELPALADIRARVQAELDALPAAHRRLDDPEPYPVIVGPNLEKIVRIVN
jgi:nicotinate phosphoribosyltransferase